MLVQGVLSRTSTIRDKLTSSSAIVTGCCTVPVISTPRSPPRTPEHETPVRSRAQLTFFKASISNTVIRTTFSFNLWRNGVVALQVERAFVARITTACSTCHATNFSVVNCSNLLHEVDPSSTFCNKFFSTCNTEICQQPIRFEIWQTFLS